MKTAYMTTKINIIYISCIIAVLAFLCGCVKKGFITDIYEPEFYEVPKLLPNNVEDFSPVILVYGDTQSDWRIRNNFYRKKNWLTWKMAIFPFYELYWLYNGVSGAVNRARIAPDAGEESRRFMRETVYRLTVESDIDLVLNVGDMCANDGRRPGHWEMFLRENKHEIPLLREIPYLPVIGNHERHNDKTFGEPNYEAVFDYPPFYRIDFKDISLFVLDSNILLDWKNEIPNDLQDELFENWFVSSDADEPSWFEKELRYCENPFKIVAMHHSPLSFGRHWKDWYKISYGRNTTQKRKALLRVMANNGVQVVFSGHEHIYQHNFVSGIPGSASEDTGIHFIVSSGGGVPLRDVKSERAVGKIKEIYEQEGYVVDLIEQENVHHYCIVKAENDELSIETYLVTGDSNESDELFEQIRIAPNLVTAHKQN